MVVLLHMALSALFLVAGVVILRTRPKSLIITILAVVIIAYNALALYGMLRHFIHHTL